MRDSSTGATPHEDRHTEASRFSREILPAVSRTFALSIRLLPGALGTAVQCAYLLCRIADTVEDDPALDATTKAALLGRLAIAFERTDVADGFPAEAANVSGDAAHVQLVRHADLVFVIYRGLPAAKQRFVKRWVLEMIAGMRKFVLAYPRGIRIQSIEEYREYCYYVAGTVGYMLTDLWHEHSPSIGARHYQLLRERSRAFAEALQTVNILKDVSRDARQENAIYVPEQLLQAHGTAHASMLSAERGTQTQAALGTLVQLAWHDLDQATAYLMAIPRRAVAIRLFCALPLVFAYATMRELTHTPGALAQRTVVKISRAEVKLLTALSVAGIMSNGALRWIIQRARTQPVLLGLAAGRGR
jgi:farnesyl-diphosphate farnesyltransferase